MPRFDELKQAQKHLKELKFSLDASAIVAIMDNKGSFIHAGKGLCDISGYEPGELLGNSHDIITSDFQSSPSFLEMKAILEKGETWQGELNCKAKDGNGYWLKTTVVPFPEADGSPERYISISHDISLLKTYEKYIDTIAHTDPLTKLPNRGQISKWLEGQKSRSPEITIMFLDLDRFRYLNENFGYDIGDKILIEVASRLRKELLEQDFITRQRGDEFMVLLAGGRQHNEIIKTAERLLLQLNRPYMIDGKEYTSTASIGISKGTFDSTVTVDDHAETLIRKAQIALRQAKKQGGNSHYCYSLNENKRFERSYILDMEIDNALNNDEFSIVYQPIVNLKNNKIVGVEALLRWYNDRLGFVGPNEFIPVLEKTGMIIPVGKWILAAVCRQMKVWQEAGIMMQRVCVNVSPIQFQDRNFVSDLKEILNESLLDASYLEIEITEGAILDITNSSRTINELKGLGVKVSIDDFGTGYSSLSYLKQLPIDTLKIDKSFIDDLDRDGEIIANTIISMGKNLNFRVIAEGIESEEQLNYLRKQKCHEGQGYYFSKPVKNTEITGLFSTVR